jgi:hypothetical protein
MVTAAERVSPVKVSEDRYYIGKYASEWTGLKVTSKVRGRITVEEIEVDGGKCWVMNKDKEEDSSKFIASKGVGALDPFALKKKGDSEVLGSISCKEINEVRIKIDKVWYKVKVTYPGKFRYDTKGS